MKRNYKNSDVIGRLGQIAFGRANDVVKLLFLDQENGMNLLDEMDLTMLSEMKRGSSGTMEVKLISRIDALKLLSELTEHKDAGASSEAERFLQAIGQAAENQPDEEEKA